MEQTRSEMNEAPPLLSLKSYVSESKSSSVTIHGAELTAIFAAFARANDYPLHELMGNVGVVAGKRMTGRRTSHHHPAPPVHLNRLNAPGRAD